MTSMAPPSRPIDPKTWSNPSGGGSARHGNLPNDNGGASSIHTAKALIGGLGAAVYAGPESYGKTGRPATGDAPGATAKRSAANLHRCKCRSANRKGDGGGRNAVPPKLIRRYPELVPHGLSFSGALRNSLKRWWACWDSNPRPLPCQGRHLGRFSPLKNGHVLKTKNLSLWCIPLPLFQVGPNWTDFAFSSEKNWTQLDRVSSHETAIR